MRILVVAPHADDETIGVGGTIARYVAEGHDVVVAVMTGHGTEGPHPLWPESLWHRIRGEAKKAHAVLGVTETVFEEIPAVTVADQPLWKLTRITSGVIDRVEPDVLFVPFPMDLHKDHRELFHAFSVGWRTCSGAGRKIREIYCYEVVAETHWNIPYVEQGFLPNVWVDITPYLETKLKAAACYESQMRPAPDTRSLRSIKALAEWRGSQMHMEAAEAFVLVRKLWNS